MVAQPQVAAQLSFGIFSGWPPHGLLWQTAEAMDLLARISTPGRNFAADGFILTSKALVAVVLRFSGAGGVARMLGAVLCACEKPIIQLSLP